MTSDDAAFLLVSMDAFIGWWQELPTHMDPVLLSIGSFQLKYYGLMYLVAFVLTYVLALYRTKTEARFPYDSDFLQSFLTYQVLGVIIGGRVGYVLFYNLPYYLSNPLEAFLPIAMGPGGIEFRGFAGMSYHGGLLGVIVSGYLFTRKYRVSFWNLADLFAPAVPLGYTFGRLGNFINGELWGRPTEAAIGMIFPDAPGLDLRHPSQLYEGFFEGLVLFLILWAIRRRPFPEGAMMPFYIFGYGFFRFFLEFYREPDEHLGFVFLSFSMGQLLCMAMMIAGIALYLWVRKHNKIPVT